MDRTVGHVGARTRPDASTPAAPPGPRTLPVEPSPPQTTTPPFRPGESTGPQHILAVGPVTVQPPDRHRADSNRVSSVAGGRIEGRGHFLGSSRAASPPGRWRGLAGADRVRRTETVTVPLVSFTPQVAAAAPLAALGLRLAGRRGPAATAVLASAALGLMVRSREIPRRQPQAGGPTLRVLTINLLVGRADAGRGRRPGPPGRPRRTVPAGAHRQRANPPEAGRPGGSAAAHADRAPGRRPARLRHLLPVPAQRRAVAPPTFAAQPTALLELPGRRRGRADLRAPAGVWPAARRLRPVAGGAGRSCHAPGKRPRVVAGDFNATVDHAAFRDVLRLGYADAAVADRERAHPHLGPAGQGACGSPSTTCSSPGAARCSATRCTTSPAAITGPSARRSGSPSPVSKIKIIVPNGRVAAFYPRATPISGRGDGAA